VARRSSRSWISPIRIRVPLAKIAEAHRVGEDGHVRGKLVLVVEDTT
jgi:hypothetical protein